MPLGQAVARARALASGALARLGQSRVALETLPASPRPPAAGGASFDAERAFALLRAQCALGARAPGSPAHAATRALIVEHLRATADAVAEQRWRQWVAHGPGAGRRFALTNVLARFDGRDGGAAPELMLSAHWDTRPVADHDPDPARRAHPVIGASDGASGVAVLLELARVLAARRPARTTVLALWDGEDFGAYYYGSRLFARVARRPEYAPWRARRGVLVDMVGGEPLRCTTEEFSRRVAPALWERVHAAADALGLAAHFRGPARWIVDDHVFLSRGGIPTVLLIDYGYPHWHTTRDVPEHCSARSLGVVGAVLERLAVDDGAAP